MVSAGITLVLKPRRRSAIGDTHRALREPAVPVQPTKCGCWILVQLKGCFVCAFAFLIVRLPAQDLAPRDLAFGFSCDGLGLAATLQSTYGLLPLMIRDRAMAQRLKIVR